MPKSCSDDWSAIAHADTEPGREHMAKSAPKLRLETSLRELRRKNQRHMRRLAKPLQSAREILPNSAHKLHSVQDQANRNRSRFKLRVYRAKRANRRRTSLPGSRHRGCAKRLLRPSCNLSRATCLPSANWSNSQSTPCISICFSSASSRSPPSPVSSVHRRDSAMANAKVSGIERLAFWRRTIVARVSSVGVRTSTRSPSVVNCSPRGPVSSRA